MEVQIITIFCVLDNILKFTGFRDDWQVTMTSSEIMTIAITSGFFFSGNLEETRNFFSEYKLVRTLLSKSQFNRRLHAIDGSIWELVFNTLAEIFKEGNDDQEYIVNSFPIAVFDNIRISTSKIYKAEEYRGRMASKRRFFYGLRGHMITTKKMKPIEFILAPGSYSDARVFKNFQLDLPSGALLYGDPIYTNYNYEAIIEESMNVRMLIARKTNSKRQHQPWINYLIGCSRKMIETAFSQITALFPKKIHAVTSKGFELKIICFILAYSFNLL